MFKHNGAVQTKAQPLLAIEKHGDLSW